MKTKTINYENGIAFYITNRKESYTKLAHDIEKELNQLGISADVTSRRVKDWAHGTVPRDNELNAICMLKYNNTRQWKDLYFPNQQYVLAFLKWDVLTQVKKVLKNQYHIKKFVEKKSLPNLFIGLADQDAPLKTLASILITEVYFKINNRNSLKSKTTLAHSTNYYLKSIVPYLTQFLNSIPSDCLFVQNATVTLRQRLQKNKTNRTNIRREGLIQIINII